MLLAADAEATDRFERNGSAAMTKMILLFLNLSL